MRGMNQGGFWHHGAVMLMKQGDCLYTNWVEDSAHLLAKTLHAALASESGLGAEEMESGDPGIRRSWRHVAAGFFGLLLTC